MNDHEDMSSDREIPLAVAVRTGDGDDEWAMTVARDGRDWRLTLASPGGTWNGVGPDCFKAQRDLRSQLDGEGILLGVNGARPNSWCSGMQCDMGEGRVTYLLQLGLLGRPEQVRTLDAAPLDAVGTVAEQDDFQSRWRRERHQ